MKRFIFVFALILLSLIVPVLADDVVTSTGYITLEIKESPPIVNIKTSYLSGFLIKEIENKGIPIDRNILLITFILFLLIIITLFNSYQYLTYRKELKSIT